MTLRYGSVCSGIEAATVAWKPLGWRAAWFAETDRFCRSLLAHHYPDTPNFGDILEITEADLERYDPIDVLVGGTPCQSFSVAGLRKGMADPRGNLALRFVQLARATRARWVLWENVPGVLSSWSGDTPDSLDMRPGRGREVVLEEKSDFDQFTAGLQECGYGFAYRVLDAQYFGVPQRRRRVFVVGHLGDWRRAAAVLFERESLSGNDAPDRPRVSAEAWIHGIGRAAGCIDAMYGAKWGSNQWYAKGHVICRNGRPSRLTPREVERCFGFPDDYTNIPYGRPKYPDQICPDRPRYKALGNSMAVPVMRWIGERIEMVEAIET